MMLIGMELRHLRYFVAVAEERHFGRAAEKVGTGQPPLSQQIQALERELGTPLFRRIPRKLELTHAGEALLEDARRILARAEQAVRNVERASRGDIGRLSIGFTPASSFNPFVPATIRAFRQIYPGIVLKLREDNSEILCTALLDGHVDIAFVRPPAADTHRLVIETVLDEHMVIAVPKGHDLAKAPTIDLKSLAQQPFVLYPRKISPNVYDTVITACHAAGFTPQVVQEAPQMPSAVNFVASGIGVTVVPASMQWVHTEDVAYRPVRGKPLHVPLELAFRRDNASPGLRNFVNLAYEVARTGFDQSRLTSFDVKSQSWTSQST